MKTDNYLTLCLEQASKSSLHYRHGAIIVRGGKVIGQGFNEIRSGFDGGALKTGAIATSPEVSKRPSKNKISIYPIDDEDAAGRAMCAPSTFAPFENMGGGHNVNTPLTMHSEMMAIQSALSASRTLDATTALSQKPYFKLPGLSKRKALLRRESLKSYVSRVCSEASAIAKQSVAQQHCGSARVQEWQFEATASQPDRDGQKEQQRQRGEESGEGEREWSERDANASMQECRERPGFFAEEFFSSWSSEGFSLSSRPSVSVQGSPSHSARTPWTTRTMWTTPQDIGQA